MKIQLSEIMNANISELSDLDMELSFEIESIERQLSSAFIAKKHGPEWVDNATKAKGHLERTQALVKKRLEKLYYADNPLLHGAILAEVRKMMPLGQFMSCVTRAKGVA